MSSSPSKLPDFSTLAAKPPQRPTENLPSRPSTSNYKSALVSAAEKDRQTQATTTTTTQSRPPNLNLNLNIEGDGNGVADAGQEAAVSPMSASWRPNLDRQQSWNMQDQKRAMQVPLMSPKLERAKNDYGFSSKDDDEEDKQATKE